MGGAERGVGERAGDREAEAEEEEEADLDAVDGWMPRRGALVLLLSLWVRSFSVWDLRGGFWWGLGFLLLGFWLEWLSPGMGLSHKPVVPAVLAGVSVDERLLPRLLRRAFKAGADRKGDIDLGKEARTSLSDSLESSSSAQMCCGLPV